jgi:DNA repair protein RecN (Recombination protein N)
LAEQADRLTHAEDIRLAVIAAHEALSSESFDSLDAINRLGEARKFLEHVSSHDPQLEQQAQRLRQLGFELNDVAAALNGYLAGLDADSAMSLEAVQERRAKLNGLIRRFGPSLQEVIDYRERAGQRLLQLDNSEQTVDALTELVAHEHARVVEFGARLTELRRAAAASLSQRITIELAGLAMGGASVSVDVTTGELTTTGFDQVAILLSAYPGAEPRPVAKSASGGELSRIMLAIEVVLAGSERAPTFIFDEVDAGVGGAAAIEVGKRLKQLAQSAQVIVVTHLAQVAAFANHHLRVNKTVGEEFTVSDVSSLTQDERVEELARMLSGLSDSSAAQSHARELLLLGETA